MRDGYKPMMPLEKLSAKSFAISDVDASEGELWSKNYRSRK
jgi:hypothetical protein